MLRTVSFHAPARTRALRIENRIENAFSGVWAQLRSRVNTEHVLFTASVQQRQDQAAESGAKTSS